MTTLLLLTAVTLWLLPVAAQAVRRWQARRFDRFIRQALDLADGGSE